ncbi:Mitovirus RNA-dependent RNA polymerase, partial [Striga hermonthica]
PLGYYASWPLFAFSHHLLVWIAAERVYPGLRFDKYCVLGDDVVIADKQVAPVYASLLDDLGVDISVSKSLVSETGCVEFAKRFLVDGLKKDLSPVSARCVQNYYHPHGLAAIDMKYKVKRFSTLCRIGGSGYRTLATLSSSSSKVIRRRRAIWYHYRLPVEWWLGRGGPLDPYMRGFLIDVVRKEYRPRDLKVVPDHYFYQIGMKEFQEWSILRRWVKRWLDEVHWYASVALDPCVSLQVILEGPPVVEKKWNFSAQDPNLVRFGLLWKLYDLVGSLGPSWRPGILSEGSSIAKMGYLLGPCGANSFLVSALGLEQPRAGRGVIYPLSGNAPHKTIRNKTLGVFCARPSSRCVVTTYNITATSLLRRSP